MNTQPTGKTLVFPGSWRKCALLFFATLVFASMCWPNSEVTDPFTYRLGWVGVAIFVLLAVVILFQLARGYPRLTLDEKGFEFSIGSSLRRYEWSDIHSFSVRNFIGPSLIHFFYSSSYSGSGNEGEFFNLYAATTYEICDALSSWRERWADGA